MRFHSNSREHSNAALRTAFDGDSVPRIPMSDDDLFGYVTMHTIRYERNGLMFFVFRCGRNGRDPSRLPCPRTIQRAVMKYGNEIRNCLYSFRFHRSN